MRSWCKPDSQCLFCQKYVPMRDTYRNMLDQTDHCFLWSIIYTSRPEYYKQHIEYLDAWCAKWNIPVLTGDAEHKAELLKVKNWTREYWH
jgi:hypothetical protein